MAYIDLKINNSRKAAIGLKKGKITGQWKDPGAKLYNQLLDAHHIEGNKCIEDSKELDKAIKEGKYLMWDTFLKEAYMVAPVKDIKNSPYGVTPFSRSGCKYPHHVIKNGELVVSIPGLRAAYICARNQGVLVNHTPENKQIVAHFNRHFKELGITPEWRYGELYFVEDYDIQIDGNFNSIYSFIMEETGINLFNQVDEYTEGSRGKLKFAYRIALDCMTHHTLKITYELNPEMDDNYISGKYWDYSHPNEELTRNRIREEGNLDFNASNMRVLSIEDMSDKDSDGKPKRLKEAYTCGPIYPIDKEVFGNLKKIKELADEPYSNVFYIKVGEIDKSRVTKTTNLPKGINKLPDEYLRNVGSPGSRSGRGVNAHLGKGHKYNPKKSNEMNESAMSNEASVLNSDVRKEIGDTPEKIYQWMNYNIKYDDEIENWKLRNPSDVYLDKKGNCHDQSFFEALLFHSLNIVNGQLFFIEFCKDKPIGGRTHTLTWFRKGGNGYSDFKEPYDESKAYHGSYEYFWFENAWESQSGIHGPYSNLNELKEAVFEECKKDHTEGFDGIVFSTLSNYRGGMSLDEYVKSWRLEDDRLFNEDSIKMDYMCNECNKLTKDATIIIDKNPDIDRVKKLHPDWDLDNGELGYVICPNCGTRNDVIINYNEIIKESSEWIDKFVNNDSYNRNIRKSENKIFTSGDFNKFKISDEELEDIMNRPLDESTELSLEDFNDLENPVQLYKWMKSIKYGWIAKDGEVHGTGDNDSSELFFDEYRLQSPIGLMKTKVGVCWDQVELERKWFLKHRKPHTVVYIEIEDGEDCPSHTFLVYKHEGESKEVYWFEHSWGQMAGIHKYKDFNTCIADVTQKFIKSNNSKGNLIIRKLGSPMKRGLTCQEYMDAAHSEFEIDIHDISYDDIFNESYQYFDEKSHSKLKYCYRVGFDIVTGKEVAIEFILDPDKIIKVGDEENIKNASTKSGTKVNILKIANNAVDIAKENIKKYGHIDFLTDDLKVNNIFFKDGKSVQSVDFIPMFSKEVTSSMNKVARLSKLPKGTPSKDIFINTSFPFILRQEIKSNNSRIEHYEIGEVNGKDKYKTTKLMWDHDLFLSYKYTPVLRGVNGRGRYVFNKPEDIEDLRNYLKNNLNNKYTESYCDDIEILESIYHDNTFHGYTSRHINLPFWTGYGYDINESIESIYSEAMVLDEESMINDKIFNESEELSEPKKVDVAESNKNGVNRKKLYIAFIEWCKEYNSKNTFGSIFDKDAFRITYSFVPNEMRYFYRLANPILCVLGGQLTFFQVSELKKLNSKNSKFSELMIFAATPNDMRVFNTKDKRVYKGTEENGELKLNEVLGETFDLYIQNMIKKGDILNSSSIEENIEVQPE